MSYLQLLGRRVDGQLLLELLFELIDHTIPGGNFHILLGDDANQIHYQLLQVILHARKLREKEREREKRNASVGYVFFPSFGAFFRLLSG